MRPRLDCAVLVLLLPLGVAADWVMEDLGDPPEGYSDPNVRDLNERGQVVGSVYSDDFQERVFVWEDGNWTILPTLGGRWAYTTGIKAPCRFAIRSTPSTPWPKPPAAKPSPSRKSSSSAGRWDG